jgi:dTDP-4-dehydrorhamnose reductase
MTPRRFVVFGRTGQVASELARAPRLAGVELSSIDRAEADLAGPAGDIAAALSRHAAGAASIVVINAAGYTAVDRAEGEAEACQAANCRGPAAIARACAERGYPLIHLSTDYVFDGRKPEPYREDDPVAPESVYGRSKLAGEEAIRAAGPAHVILRTAWVYSPFGTNFVKTMLRLGRERPELGIVNDQLGCPTAAKDIAETIVSIATRLAAGKADGYGTFHYCGAGACTWFDFAREIFAHAARWGYQPPRVKPITTADYPTAARRPANSVLDCSKIRAVYNIGTRPWQTAVAACIEELLGSKGGV